MVNALGVLGWGVGGIEIETVVLGQSYILPKPEFVGVRLDGALADGITVTDLALTLTEQLRAAGVVGACVEFFGPAAGALTVPDRATLANMAPEYGATTGFWPVDEQTIAYLRMTGRSAEHVALVEAHARAAGLFRTAGAADPVYDRVIAFDLGKVRRSIAGPGMPHIRQDTSGVAASFRERAKGAAVAKPQAPDALPEGAIGIAAITSCTNTSNPHGMIRAGLVAKAAVERGLQSAPWVKTSLAPGSRAVTTYLDRAGLLAPLEALGFGVIGYGCTTCAGKSGPLKPVAAKAVEQDGRTIAAVLSGNRNFDGRIHRLVGANYLCSPALVVAFALAGRVDHRYRPRPDRKRRRRRPRLPPRSLAGRCRGRCRCPADRHFRSLRQHRGGKSPGEGELGRARGTARSIVRLGCRFDLHCRAAIFRDHTMSDLRWRSVSKACACSASMATTSTRIMYRPAAKSPRTAPRDNILQSVGVRPAAFNSYVGRRGNHHVMMRGTYGNVRIRNRMADGREGWWTKIYPEGETVTIPDAAMRYRERNVPLIVLGGRNFGAGSSRDWAAKGPALLGVRAVIARSFERIHRSNLIGVGVVPLLFADEDGVDALKLDGSEEFTFEGIADGIARRAPIGVIARRSGGEELRFEVTADVRSAAEADLLQRGGMFQAALEASLK